MGFQQGFRINTNTASLDTYRAYSKSQAGLEQNIERLSSGKRINSAKDDAAGLAISERMNNKIRGMQQANRNVQQGTNLIQTTEGGLDQIQNILGRMRELAVQSASDTMNIDDRGSINLEFNQLKAEITQIADSTEYNGMKLLDGSRNGVGSTDGVTNITDLVDSLDGLSTPLNLTIHNDQIYWTDWGTNKIQRSNLDGSNVTDLVTTGLSDPYSIIIHNNQIYWTDSGTDKIQRSNLDGSNVTDLVTTGLSTLRGLTIHNDQIYWADVGTNKIQRSNLDGSNVTDLMDSSDGLSGPHGLAIVNDQIYWADADSDKIQRANLDGSNVTDLVTTGLSEPDGLIIHNNHIYWTDYQTDKLQRSNLDGSNVTDLMNSSDGLSNPHGLTIHNDHIYWTDFGTNKIQRGNLPSDGTNVTLQVGTNNTTNDQISLSIESATVSNLSLSDTNVVTLGDTQSTINGLDTAIQQINDQRSTLGTTQNRLEFASSNLMNSIQNNSASMSTIRDADFAVEAAELAKNQILTQSSSAMLAQANGLSQNVLSLIR